MICGGILFKQPQVAGCFLVNSFLKFFQAG